jgi:hypothetical protein
MDRRDVVLLYLFRIFVEIPFSRKAKIIFTRIFAKAKFSLFRGPFSRKTKNDFHSYFREYFATIYFRQNPS